jgi:hypothetical protein
MEEEKKIEETSTEPKHEVEEAVEEKKETPFLEPRPYKRQSKAETSFPLLFSLLLRNSNRSK